MKFFDQQTANARLHSVLEKLTRNIENASETNSASKRHH